jgi:L-serine dehydratase
MRIRRASRPSDWEISMQKLFYPDFFNDVFGPIMQPGSSGSFAGTSRVGRIARHTLKSAPRRVRILFNPGDSHFVNLGNMMEDRGYLGGLQDFATDDIRLFDAHSLARASHISYSFERLPASNGREGSVSFELEGVEGDTATLSAKSIGGGMVRTYEIHGFPLEWQADTNAVLVFGEADKLTDESSAAFVRANTDDLVNVVRSKRADGARALFFELSIPSSPAEMALCFPGAEIRILPALLPVVTTRKKRPQLFKTVEEWREVADKKGISFADAAIEYERASSGWERNEIWDYFEGIAAILGEQIHSLESVGYDRAKDTPLLPIYGRKWDDYARGGRELADPLTGHILRHAFSTNAKLPGVRIVPGPMGTGGGYLFSALDAVREARGYSHERMIEALAVAAGLGVIAFTHTNASGEVGCVGESGVCCAMASGAVTWLAGGDGRQVENAASMALQANFGIPCDPIPGGLEFPCLTRTLRAAVTAPLYADLALCGIDPLVPYHECLQAIDENYHRAIPRSLCGGECGLNRTKTARRCLQFLQSQMDGNYSYEAGT